MVINLVLSENLTGVGTSLGLLFGFLSELISHMFSDCLLWLLICAHKVPVRFSSLDLPSDCFSFPTQLLNKLLNFGCRKILGHSNRRKLKRLGPRRLWLLSWLSTCNIFVFFPEHLLKCFDLQFLALQARELFRQLAELSAGSYVGWDVADRPINDLGWHLSFGISMFSGLVNDRAL